MSRARSVRGWQILSVAAAVTIATVGLGAMRQTDASAAASSNTSNYGMTITKVGVGTGAAPAKVAGGTANQQITITGVGFDEAFIDFITLGADTNCLTLRTYVVVSSTSIIVKTPATGSPVGCLVTTGSPVVAEDVTLTEVTNGSSVGVINFSGGVIFAAPPAILAIGSRPVIADNSAGLGTTLAPGNHEVQSLIAPGAVVAGAQRVRVRAATSAGGATPYEFDNRTSAGLVVSIGGKPLTAVSVYNSDGSLQAVGAGPATVGGVAFADVGGWLIGTLGVPLASTVAPTLTITQFGVTRSFTAAVTGVTWYAGPTVTSLDVTSGRAAGGTTVKITGTGFDAATVGNNTVNFCSITAVPTVTAGVPAGTGLTVTSPAVAALALGLGTSTWSGVCAVTVTVAGSLVVSNGTSPVTAGNAFAYVSS